MLVTPSTSHSRPPSRLGLASRIVDNGLDAVVEHACALGHPLDVVERQPPAVPEAKLKAEKGVVPVGEILPVFSG